MKRRMLALVIALALVALVVPAAVFAADTGTVSCTVSGILISVSVTDGDVHYGTVNVGAHKNTVLYNESTNPDGMTLADTQTATNDGSATENFNIKSSDATGATQNWTLAATQGDHQFTHEFSINSGSAWSFMTTSYQSLKTSVAKDDTQTFDLRIGMPTTTTDYLEHTITVTVQAVQHS